MLWRLSSFSNLHLLPSNKKLVVTGALLVVAGALLVVTGASLVVTRSIYFIVFPPPFFFCSHRFKAVRSSVAVEVYIRLGFDPRTDPGTRFMQALPLGREMNL